jgi:starch-binding outer membrane protein, SusD/RagB family
MKRYTLALLAGMLVAAGCKDSTAVNPQDAPKADALAGPLIKSGLQTLAIALLSSDRQTFVGTGSAYPILANIYARDIYRLDPSEPRYLNETIQATPDRGSFAGGGGWTGQYVTIRQANTMLQALANPSPGVFTAAELSAATGFAQTFKAIAYYRILEMRDTIGVALQKDDPTDTDPAAIICKKNMIAYVAALLDSANTNLVAAGNITFPWAAFPSGMTGFGRDYRRATNFILFNRGWKGKVDLYRGLDHQNPNAALFTQAITELTQALGGVAAGAVPASTFQTGMYYVFVPAGTEAAPNPYSDTRIGINPALDSVRAGDTRASKITTRSTVTIQGVTLTKTLTRAVPSSANQAAPLPVLKDEELVLLRAQAEFEAGQFTQGYADLNSVHTAYGLAPYVPSVVLDQARSDLLYDKRYSLLGEGVQRLVDLRAYSRLNATFYPKQTATDVYNTAFPIPKAEFDARGGDVTPTCS